MGEEEHDDGAVELFELGSPLLLGIRKAESPVDEHEAALHRQQVAVNVTGPRRQGHRHAQHASRKLVHDATLALFPTC